MSYINRVMVAAPDDRLRQLSEHEECSPPLSVVRDAAETPILIKC